MIGELLAAYLEHSSLERFEQLRAAALAHPAYDPYGSVLREAQGYLSRKRPRAARDLLLRSSSGWVLAPEFHNLLSVAFGLTGNEEEARLEAALARCLLDGILSTGDGSRQRPYLVSCPSDEYAILEALGKQMTSQTLTENDGRMCDVLTTDDGESYWFDIAAAFARLREGAPAECAPRRWWEFWKR